MLRVGNSHIVIKQRINMRDPHWWRACLGKPVRLTTAHEKPRFGIVYLDKQYCLRLKPLNHSLGVQSDPYLAHYWRSSLELVHMNPRIYGHALQEISDELHQELPYSMADENLDTLRHPYYLQQVRVLVFPPDYTRPVQLWVIPDSTLTTGVISNSASLDLEVQEGDTIPLSLNAEGQLVSVIDEENI